MRARSVTENENKIEVYQMLELCLNVDRPLDIRSEFENVASSSPWHRDKKIEQSIENSSTSDTKGVIAFERNANQDLPAVQLVLWPDWDNTTQTPSSSYQYRLGNIVSVEGPALGVNRFNNVLSAFVTEILSPLEHLFSVQISLSPRLLTMEDLTSKAAASALRTFSAMANKSTGANHPADEARWWDFIIRAHKSRGTLTASLLEQWLFEVDRWDSETAAELASDFEKSRDLLKAYDSAA